MSSARRHTGVRPAGGRPPATRRPRPVRRGAATVAAGTPERALRVEARRTSQKRTRIAVLGLVLAVVLVSAALPLRDYLAQRTEIGKLQLRQQQAQARVVALEQERNRLQDPTYVASEARRRLHFVLPGETAYVLLEPEPVPGAAETGAPAEGAAADPQAPPWYSQLWGSVREADRPAAQ